MAMRTPSNTIAESFVNLIPTIGGGTHVNGLRSGLTDALKEFCEFRNLIPKNIKLTPDDVWQRIFCCPINSSF